MSGQKWYYKSAEWEECIKAFDAWEKAARLFYWTGDESNASPFVAAEFDDEPDITEQCVTFLHTVAGLDPSAVWETTLAIGREVRTASDDGSVGECLRRAELLGVLIRASGLTTEKPSAKSASRGAGRQSGGRKPDPKIAERNRFILRLSGDGLKPGAIAERCRDEHYGTVSPNAVSRVVSDARKQPGLA
ncbi:MAG: hypothetical protein AAGA92_15675 [Planctomycetota bacterium]